MKSFFSSALAATVFFSSARAHMELAQPTPFPLPSSDGLAPLDPSGNNFPCKGVPYNGQGIDNHAAVGEDVPLSFKGSAVHGGGSCQISLTTDLAPSKNTKWFVIHSIEGGCPAKNTAGNGQAGTNAGSNYTFKIPDGVAPGKYTLAWTWFDRLAGQPEMYMNCAPFTVSGGKKRAVEVRKEAERFQRRQANFPDMYLANICGGKCKTTPNKDPQFPDPGAYVDKFGDPSMLVMQTCACGPNGDSAPVSGSSSSSQNSSSSSGSQSGSPSGSPAASSSAPQPLNQGTATASSAGTASTDASSGSDSSTAASAAGPASTAADSAPSAATSMAASSPSDTGSSTSSGGGSSTAGGSAGGQGSQSCSSPGSVVCSSDGKMFGICDTNSKAVMQAVAMGTTCSNGQIAAEGSASNGTSPASSAAASQ